MAVVDGEIELPEEVEGPSALPLVPRQPRLRRHLLVLDMNGLLIDRRRRPLLDLARNEVPPDLTVGCARADKDAYKIK